MASPTSILESSSSSKLSNLTSSDKLSELPVSASSSPNNRAVRSQAARAMRRSLDSLPSFSTESGHSPRISQAWGTTLPASKSFPQVNGSDGHETPKQRVSFDSDRPQGFVRSHRESDPPAFESASQPRSRAASPLRIFQHLSASFHRRNDNRTDDPFVPINPFEITIRLPGFGLFLTPTEKGTDSSFEHAKTFFTDTLPRQVYLYLLLRLPSMYFSRVARIFEDADVSRPDIERMIDAGMTGDSLELYSLPTAASVRDSIAAASARATPTPSVGHLPLPVPEDWTPAVVSPALIRFKYSWEDFIGSLIKEWKTLNVVSALLLSAILTMFQIPPAASDPVTRTTALLSLVSALMSLCYGCVYIVRFSTMGSMYRASKFAEEARKTDTFIWWNVWTLLAMPAVFLAWSVVFFILSITTFVWRTGSVLDPDERQSLGRHAVLGPRIAVSVVLFIGLVYFGLIIATLRRYGQGPTRRGRGDLEAQTRGRAVERAPRLGVGVPSRAEVGQTEADAISEVKKENSEIGAQDYFKR
ncbi:hypothetical protein FB45DRAFT_1063108 [Roridomyces roridus]|uniref:Uncharacterized protein n=1 Tax=Roridomyces roridus TaxID=1738132 RepID=A0AAD7FH37_9AGAR|nr:hypothetical protein FB45DRAFT_1063108 [Roridomyces roridus]